MFCQHCQSCFAVAIDHSHINQYPEIVLHFSTRSWFASISRGCFSCRWIWYNLVHVVNVVCIERNECNIKMNSMLPLSFETFRQEKRTAQRVLEANWGHFGEDSNRRKRDKALQLLLRMCSSTPQILMRLFRAQHLLGKVRVVSTSQWVVLLQPSQGKLNNALEIHILIKNMKVPVIRGNDQMTLELCSTPDLVRLSKIPHVKERERHSSTKDSVSQWNRWLTTCMDDHEKCRSKLLDLFLPKRLIEVDTRDACELRWRMVEPSVSNHVKYLTLSHCWGTFYGLMLTRATLEDFQKGMNSSELGQTFIDALDITVKLGYRYIWIDSLCILQDDLDDWKAQASLMAKIYAHADCNIAASWASDDSQGCYHDRDAHMCEQACLQLELRQSKQETVSVYDRWSWTNDVSLAILNTRAWVVQERFVASRQLNFTSSRVYWECESLSASEQYPTGLTLGIADGVKPVFPREHEPEQGRKAWCTAVQMYTRSYLSHETDRPIAIAGLASILRNMTQDTYIAGLWRNDLIKQLCWKALRYREHKSVVPYQGPSWSWMGISGPVQMDYRWHDSSFEAISLAKVCNLDFESISDSGLDGFRDCRLTLKGLLAWADMKGDSFWNTVFTMQSESEIFGPFPEIPAWDIYWDIGPSWEAVQQTHADGSGNLDFCFVFICGFGRDWCPSYSNEDFNCVQGLVLRRDHEKASVFRKVGTFETMGLSELPWQLAQQLGLPDLHAANSTINIDEVKIEMDVGTITIV